MQKETDDIPDLVCNPRHRQLGEEWSKCLAIPLLDHYTDYLKTVSSFRPDVVLIQRMQRNVGRLRLAQF